MEIYIYTYIYIYIYIYVYIVYHPLRIRCGARSLEWVPRKKHISEAKYKKSQSVPSLPLSLSLSLSLSLALSLSLSLSIVIRRKNET
jgi:hypothetical protein